MLRGINLPSRYQQLLLFSIPFKSFCFRSVSHRFQRWTCTGLELCPCFPNILARTTFSLFPCERLKFLARMLFWGISALFWRILRIFFLEVTNFFVEFTHFFVYFCHDRRLRASSKIFKILASRLFSSPCLSQILSSTPGLVK